MSGLTKRQRRRERVAQICEQIAKPKRSLSATELRRINRQVDMKKGKTK